MMRKSLIYEQKKYVKVVYVGVVLNSLALQTQTASDTWHQLRESGDERRSEEIA
jgi:hypothetical protein